MKREDVEKLLKENGLSEDKLKAVTDGVMDANGKDIERYKTEVSSLKEQLATANTTIEKFKDVDVDQIKQQAEDYKNKFEAAEADGKAKLEKMQFDHALERALTGAKAKNPKAVRAMLDEDGLKLNGESIIGLDEQIKKIRKSDGYLFESEEKLPKFADTATGLTGATGSADKNAQANAALRAALGKE